MLAPELIRIQEKPLANWVTPAKVNAIRGEFMRQCDKLDGLADGIINNYPACRAIFDIKQGKKGRDPWAAKRCAGKRDPDPEDTSAKACLTDGQAPEHMMAKGKSFPGVSRPVCAYPTYPRYRGTGSQDDAANFECK